MLWNDDDDQRLASSRSNASDLRRTCEERRAEARVYRRQLAARRYETMQTILRSRQLRFDRQARMVAVWNGDEHGSCSAAADALDEAINSVYRIGLLLSSLARVADGPDRPRLEAALDELDQLIRRLRRFALDGQIPRPQVPPPAAEHWLEEIKAVTTGIDAMLSGHGTALTVAELNEASQAAHRAIIALGDAVDRTSAVGSSAIRSRR